MCPECGAVDPMATPDDPPGHAEHLWNQRFGVGASRTFDNPANLPRRRHRLT
jgi:hypothetical protein